MVTEALPSQAVLAYSILRSLGFSLEYKALQKLGDLMPGASARFRPAPELSRKFREKALAILREDAENIRSGVYPISVLTPESPVRHVARLGAIVPDGLAIFRRKKAGRTAVFDDGSRELLDDVPRYYRRNFHFQTNGYLSERSAELYEHEVELLFSGTADAMRRMVIPPMKAGVKARHDESAPLRILEVGSGTGRATRFVHQAFPKAKITSVDLSYPYLQKAQERLRGLPRIDYYQGDAANLPFRSESFDIVFSTFVHHEIPENERQDVISECSRLLRAGGTFVLLDSLQKGDEADFDPLLENFPRDFHEPFYRNYTLHPLKGMLANAGLAEIAERNVFLSKVCWATKPGA